MTTPNEEPEEAEDKTPRYQCPRCGKTDQINVSVVCYARLDQSDPSNLETEIDTSDQEWDDDSTMQCSACLYSGKMHDCAEAALSGSGK
jgi:hypothetical protein